MPRANEIKKGMVLNYNGKLLIVKNIDIQSPSARGAATLYKMRFSDVSTGLKVEERFKGDDMVDTVTFAKTTYAPVPLKFEAGTANFTGAIALGEAVKFVGRFDPAEVEAHEAALLHRATERLTAVDGLRIYGTTPGKCAIVSFNVEGVHPYDMGMILDKLGIAVRTGQHCAEPTMTHFSTTGMCRASFALYNTLAEADALAGGVERAVRMLRG